MRFIDDPIVNLLWALPPTGEEGFEGVVASLLSSLTGFKFRLAASGSQRGRDASTLNGDELFVKIEAKRYSPARRLNSEALLGKLQNAVNSAPNLDLWILASTTSVDANSAEDIVRAAASLGVHCEILDSRPGELHPLSVLCAAFPEVLDLFLLRRDSKAQVRKALRQTKRDPAYLPTLNGLRERLSAARVGYVAARAAMEAKFLDYFSHTSSSQANLADRVCPEDSTHPVVERSELLDELDTWWDFQDAKRSLGVILGGERCGKSWLVAAWLARRAFNRADGPIVAWVPSRDLDLAEAASRDLLETFKRHLIPKLAPRDAASAPFWSRCIERWSKRRGTLAPSLLLVLDGLNEPADVSSASRFLQRTRSEHYGSLGGLAVLVTCRRGFWQEVIGLAPDPQTSLSAAPAENAEPPFEMNVGEFSVAEISGLRLSAAQRVLVDHPRISAFVRSPKYFQAVLRLGSRLLQAAEISPALLFFEEWRDRIAARLGTPMNEVTFHDTLMKLAEAARADRSETGRVVEPSTLAFSSEFGRVLEELRTGGVLENVPAQPGKFRVREEPLFLGLGLHLLAEIEGCATKDYGAARELIERYVAPDAGLEENATILGHALVAAFHTQSAHRASRACREVLLEALAIHKNGMASWIRFAPWVFFDRAPEEFISVAERVWSSDRTDHVARQRISYALVSLVEAGSPHASIVSACERWLRLFHESHVLGVLSYPIYPEGSDRPVAIPASNECEMQLAGLAIEIVAASREPTYFTRALVGWSLAQGAMNNNAFATEVSWIIRRGGNSLSEALFEEAEPLPRSGEPSTIRAALLLNSCIGSAASLARVKRLATRLGPKQERQWEQWGRPWSEAEARSRISSGDFGSIFVARALSSVALVPGFRGSKRLESKLAQEMKELRIAEVRPGLQWTEADSSLEQGEAAYTAFALRDLVALERRISRRLIREAADGSRSGTGFVEENFLLLDSSLQRLIRSAQVEAYRRRLQPGYRYGHEWDLAGLALANLEALDAQAKFLKMRGDEEENAEWSLLRAQGTESDIRDLLAELLKAQGAQARRLTWLLASQRKLPAEVRKADAGRIWKAMSDPIVGTCSDEFILRAQSPELVAHALKAKALGAHAIRYLAESSEADAMFKDLSAETLSSGGLTRVSWFLQVKKSPSSEVRAWAEALAKTLDSDAHDPEHLSDISTSTLRRAVLEQVDILAPWIERFGAREDRSSRRLRARNSYFAGTLAFVLFQTDHRGAGAVFDAWTSDPGVRMSRTSFGPARKYFIPFAAGLLPQARRAADSLFVGAVTDWELLSVLMAAENWGHYNWLSEMVAASLESKSALDRGRGCTALGLVTAPGRISKYGVRFPVSEEGWLADVLSVGRHRTKQLKFAKRWFREFARSPDDDLAWRAFRLLLQLVDARARVWVGGDPLLKSARDRHDRRWRHYAINRRAIERKAEESQKRLEKTFLGLPIPSHDVPPWKKVWNV